MRVSVIIPVYNASGSMQRSLDALQAQTCRDLELIFVDDCSRDGSLGMLNDFAARNKDLKVKIIHHDVNQGVAAARNTGLDAASGEFICFVDADDIIVAEAISKALDRADREGSDIVGWDWTLVSGKGRRYMRQADYSSAEDALKALMAGTMRWNLWLFMVRHSLYEGVRFIPRMNMGEDMMVMLRLFMRADRVSQMHDSLYDYIQTEQSVSRTMSEENIRQVSANLEMVQQALKSSCYSTLEEPYMAYLKLYVKRPLLISTDKGDYKKWASWYREADAWAWENKALPLRMRVLQALAARHLWAAVKAYNILVYGLVYRLLYR